MTSPFTDERDRIEQALTFDTGCEPSAQEIIDALNRAGYQITPKAGEETRKNVEAAIVNGWTRATQEKGSLWAAIADEIMKLIHPSNAEPIATVVNNNQPGWTAVIETAPNVTLDVGTKLYRTAPPRPACPHIRSSDEGTQWCDLAARVGDLSPSAGEAEPVTMRTADLPKWRPQILHIGVSENTSPPVHPAPPRPVAPAWQPVMRELVEAMHRYEMDVDDEPPYEHRQIMDKAHKLLSALPPDSPGTTEES